MSNGNNEQQETLNEKVLDLAVIVNEKPNIGELLQFAALLCWLFPVPLLTSSFITKENVEMILDDVSNYLLF